MLSILCLSLVALLCLALIITMIVVNIRDARASKTSSPAPDEARGPFTRPTAPANPGPIDYARTDHTHMRSGTIRETNPEHGVRSPVQTETQNPPRLRSRDGDPFDAIHESEVVNRVFDSISRSLGVLGRSSLPAPGWVVQVTQTVNEDQEGPELVAQRREREASARVQANNPKPKEPVVQRRSRYKRLLVI